MRGKTSTYSFNSLPATTARFLWSAVSLTAARVSSNMCIKSNLNTKFNVILQTASHVTTPSSSCNKAERLILLGADQKNKIVKTSKGLLLSCGHDFLLCIRYLPLLGYVSAEESIFAHATASILDVEFSTCGRENYERLGTNIMRRLSALSLPLYTSRPYFA